MKSEMNASFFASFPLSHSFRPYPNRIGHGMSRTSLRSHLYLFARGVRNALFAIASLTNSMRWPGRQRMRVKHPAKRFRLFNPLFSFSQRIYMLICCALINFEHLFPAQLSLRTRCEVDVLDVSAMKCFMVVRIGEHGACK